MKAQKLAVAAMFIALADLLASTQATAQTPNGANGGARIRNWDPPPSNSPPQTGEQKALHKKCMDAAGRLRRDAAAMVPGRTWTWRLDSERSREHLDGLRRDVKALWDTEAAFEASLSPEQRSKVNSQFTSIQELFQHLERDAQSLDSELQEGYPRRWHVANDVSDMRKEINRWRKLHQRIADELGTTH
jgi:hypothetical protein